MADTLVLEASAERRASSSLAGGTTFLVKHFTDKEDWSAVFNWLVLYHILFSECRIARLLLVVWDHETGVRISPL